MINEGIGKNGQLHNIIQKIYPNSTDANIITLTKMWGQRIKREKFRRIYESIKIQSRIETCDGQNVPNNIREIQASKQNENQLPEKKAFADIGKFEIDREEMINSNLSLKKNWAYAIYKNWKLTKCPVAVHNKYFSQELVLTVYLDCKDSKCGIKYKLVAENGIHDSKILFRVLSTGAYAEENHLKVFTRQIKGQDRVKLSIDAVNNGTIHARNKILLSTDMASSNSTNEKIIPSKDTIRKMIQETRSFADFDSEDLRDIETTKNITDNEKPAFNNPTPSYIKLIRTDTFLVGFGCESQMEAFMQNKSGICYIDATGNLTRSVLNGKRQFYYPIIFRSELTGKAIPLYEMISDKHDIATITSALLEFYRNLKLYSNKKCPIKQVSIDFSFALINAVTMSLNNCNLYHYLRDVYDILNGKTLPYEITKISCCSNHVMNFISQQLKSNLNKKQIMIAFSKSLLSNNYEDFKTNFAKLYLLLTTRYLSMSFISDITNATDKNTQILDSSDISDENSNTQKDMFEPNSSLYMTLPYLKDIQIAVENVRFMTGNGDLVLNKFHNTQFAEYLLRRMAPFSALWACYLQERSSNATIESYFKVLKHNYLTGPNQRPSRVIKDLRVNTLALVHENRLHSGFKQKAKQTESNIDDPKESFKCSKKPNITYFEQCKTNKLLDAMPIFKKLNFKHVQEKLANIQNQRVLQHQIQNFKISKSDIDTLNNGQNVSKNAINFYFKMIEAKNPSIKFMPIEIANKIFSLGVKNSQYLSKNINFRAEFLLIPAITNGEYILFAINFERNLIEFFGSSLISMRSNELILNNLLQMAYINQKIPEAGHMSILKAHSPIFCGAADSAIMIMLVARFFENGSPIFPSSFGQKEIMNYRTYIKYEISFKELV